MKDLYKTEDWLEVSHSRLGEILLDAGKINLYHISMVLDIQKFRKVPMGEIFLAMKVITEADLNRALDIQRFIRERSAQQNVD